MLLRYLIENHKSFHEPTELSFVSTARKDTPALRFLSQHTPHGVLPVVGVWGANAAGKSNLLHGLLFLRRVVQSSYIGLEPTAPVPWNPWRLRREEGAPPTRMEIDCLLDGDTRIHFGFRLDATGFVEEWLYQWKGSHRQVLYHRNHREAEPWYFGPALKGRRTQIAADTRPNSLFLSAAAQFNHPQLLPIYEAITGHIRRDRHIELRGFPLFEADDPILAPELRPTLIKLFRAADTGIIGLRTEEVELDAVELKAEAERVFQAEFLAALRSQPRRKAVHLVFQHGAPDDPWELPPEHESRGTQILLARLADAVDALRGGHLLVIDEIDTSLHPDLCAALVELFTNPLTNPNGAQLLFATHDRDLLENLRTDEVVLINKDPRGGSSLRTASDYKDLRTREDLRRVHAQGRLGGVPILGHLGAALPPQETVL